ncbi:MAG: hypothetical protein C5B58_05840 [Acidobacteria bacterium]|nr:MAG: hypothetical protein C5B58_05840 [Acidobacteriota bacterium]
MHEHRPSRLRLQSGRTRAVNRSTPRQRLAHARALAVLLIVIAWFIARADAQHLTLWTAKGEQNTVHLLGSIHVLKLSDSGLPPEILRAYEGAKTIIMELDLSSMAPAQVLNSVVDRGMLPSGQKLRDALGEDVYQKFSARATAAGLDPDFMSHFQPWFAAMLLQQVELARLGFAPDAGVDMQLASKARMDGKKIVGLETIDDQFGIFARMSLEDQRRYMVHVLSESENVSKNLEPLVSAWRTGDTRGLEELAGSSMRRSPGVDHLLITDRNMKWLPQDCRVARP